MVSVSYGKVRRKQEVTFMTSVQSFDERAADFAIYGTAVLFLCAMAWIFAQELSKLVALLAK
jgi:hypothetical protein